MLTAIFHFEQPRLLCIMCDTCAAVVMFYYSFYVFFPGCRYYFGYVRSRLLFHILKLFGLTNILKVAFFTFGLFPVRSVSSVASQEARAVELSSAVSTLSSLTSSSSGSEQPTSFRYVSR